jgi:hypothetical protein
MSDLSCIFLLLQHFMVEFFPQINFKFSLCSTFRFLFLSLFDTMLNFVENLLENERDPQSGPMNNQDHSLSLSDPDRSLVLSHLLLNFLKNLVSFQTSFIVISNIILSL